MKAFIPGPTVIIPGIRLFDITEYHHLMGMTFDGSQYITNGAWFLDLELFRASEPNDDNVEFFEGLFEKHENWDWTPIALSEINTEKSLTFLEAVFKKATKQIEITALSYHPRSGQAYRICMINDETPTPIWMDNQFIEIFDMCGLNLHATGGPTDPIVLKGKDGNGTICDYGLTMPVDFINGGNDPKAKRQMALEVFEILNRYPQITIDPNHFNIIGFKNEVAEA